MRRERADQTLQGTALVNEAYLRLFGSHTFQWKNRKHLFCAIARSMRRVLVDHARRRGADRHGGTWQRIVLDEPGPAIYRDLPEFLALSEALDKLAQLNARQSRAVEFD
jgi:RNA polymerase sigma factor (TIGR02999 family)